MTKKSKSISDQIIRIRSSRTALGSMVRMHVVCRRLSSLPLTFSCEILPETDGCTRVIETLGTEPFTLRNSTEWRVQALEVPWRITLEGGISSTSEQSRMYLKVLYHTPAGHHHPFCIQRILGEVEHHKGASADQRTCHWVLLKAPLCFALQQCYQNEVISYPLPSLKLALTREFQYPAEEYLLLVLLNFWVHRLPCRALRLRHFAHNKP